MPHGEYRGSEDTNVKTGCVTVDATMATRLYRGGHAGGLECGRRVLAGVFAASSPRISEQANHSGSKQ